MKYDKVNGNVGFVDSTHQYENLLNPNIKYISVTTLIGQYEQDFNKDFVSAYKALERLLPASEWKNVKGGIWKSKKIPKDFLEVQGISEKELLSTQQDILDEWEEKNRKACERGTKIHAEIENSFYKNSKDINLEKYKIGGKFQCKKDYFKLDMDYGVYPEYLIYYENPKLNLYIAGQIDLLVKDGTDIIIGDWKSNEKIDSKGFYDSSTRSTKKMKYPLTNIEDCNLWHYYLQLSTYAWMIQKNYPELNIKRLFIYHIDHKDNKTMYEVPYLKEDVEKMLKHFVRQQQIENQKKKYERILY